MGESVKLCKCCKFYKPDYQFDGDTCTSCREGLVDYPIAEAEKIEIHPHFNIHSLPMTYVGTQAKSRDVQRANPDYSLIPRQAWHRALRIVEKELEKFGEKPLSRKRRHKSVIAKTGREQGKIPKRLPTTKKCSRCGFLAKGIKAVALNFWRDSSTADGVDDMCKKCKGKFSRKWELPTIDTSINTVVPNRTQAVHTVTRNNFPPPVGGLSCSVVYFRDDGKCKDCGTPVEPENMHLKVIDPKGKRKAADQYNNVKLTCSDCFSGSLRFPPKD